MRPLTRDGDGATAGLSPSGLTDCFVVSESSLDDERKESSDSQSPRFSRRWPLHQGNAMKIPRSTPRTADTSPAPTIPSPVSMRSLALGDEIVHGLPRNLRTESVAASDATISSMSSRRQSIIASSFDGDALADSLGSFGPPTHTTIQHNPSESLESHLIMPSVAVSPPPAFTDFGKAIGKLKVMIAGQQGIGKTSLIHSITRLCEHITALGSSTSSQCTCEVFASTRPRLHWQSSSEAKGLIDQRRRRSSVSTERVLDRNICFVDVASETASCQHPTSDVEYLHSRAAPMLHKRLDDTELWSLLANGSYPVVDVVLYMLPLTGPTDKDIDTMKQISELTNIIPVIARVEDIPAHHIEAAKTQVAEQLAAAGVLTFAFNQEAVGTEIFAVSNVASPDLDTMDASELMNSAYEAPLIESDLQRLVDRIFSPDGAAWLRNAVALKLLLWRRRSIEHRMALQLSASRPNPGWRTHAFSWVQCDASYFDSVGWCQHVELKDWAECLRRSIATRGTDLSSQTSQELQIVHVKKQRDSERRRSRSSCNSGQAPASQEQDPLGLLVVVSKMRQERARTIELLSGLSIAVVAAACLFRT